MRFYFAEYYDTKPFVSGWYPYYFRKLASHRNKYFLRSLHHKHY